MVAVAVRIELFASAIADRDQWMAIWYSQQVQKHRNNRIAMREWRWRRSQRASPNAVHANKQRNRKMFQPMCSSIHSCLSSRLALVAHFQFFFGRPDWHRNQVKVGFLWEHSPCVSLPTLSTWNPTRSRSTSETTPAHRCGDDDDNTHTCHPWLCVCVCMSLAMRGMW